jgi:hypothetical protein
MQYRIICLLIVLISSSTANGQFGSAGAVDARSMSLAKTYTATTSGIYSIGINPANLSFNNNSFIQFSTVLPLPSVSFGTGSNFISLSELNYYFGGVNGEPRYLSEQDKENLNSLFEGGGMMFVSANVNLLSFGIKPAKRIGAFAFSINDYAGIRVSIPEALADLALSGNPVGKKFDLDNGDIKGWWIRNYSLSYSREISQIKFFDNFAAGVTLKLVHGYSYVGTEKNESYLSTGSAAEISGQTDLVGYSSFSDNLGVKYDFDSVSRHSDFSLFPSPAGTGFGFDIGFAASLKSEWFFSLAVTDIGGIRWNKNVAEFTSFGYIYIDDITNDEQIDSVKETITTDGKNIDRVSTSLPTALRVGVARLLWEGERKFPGSLLLAFDYNQGFNDMPGNSVAPRFSIAAEWKPIDYFPYLRSGFSVGGRRGFRWAFGLGVDAGIVELHFATSDIQGFVASNSTEKLSFSFSSRWKI